MMLKMQSWYSVVTELWINGDKFSDEHNGFLKCLRRSLSGRDLYISWPDYEEFDAAWRKGADPYMLICDYFPLGARHMIKQAEQDAVAEMNSNAVADALNCGRWREYTWPVTGRPITKADLDKIKKADSR